MTKLTSPQPVTHKQQQNHWHKVASAAGVGCDYDIYAVACRNPAAVDYVVMVGCGPADYVCAQGTWLQVMAYVANDIQQQIDSDDGKPTNDILQVTPMAQATRPVLGID